MTTLVKICGLSTPETLDVALDAGADMVGFVFFAPSPRNISFQTARKLSARVKGRAEKVALTVDADDAMLTDIVEALHPDLLQLHGTETPARVTAIQQRFDLPAMKVLAIESKADLGAIPLYAKIADRLLFDARAPKEATRPGGLGKPFDWHLLENLNLSIPFMLSGGRKACVRSGM
jgi:phosphoribosylanthranilate isomerase